ncbi:OmpA family protein [Archangium violaceum]|uniref:OmpA family protein n=1 Tax=Archangium violaceum TaxID=83451 RepID=UPI00193AF29B|nr:OmpA family protein [Archangium violaceum]QRK08893.1 OmpA family protein [Archangium violaceum]
MKLYTPSGSISRALVVLATLTGALFAPAAEAQNGAPSLDVNRFHPAPGSGRLLTVDLADVGRSPGVVSQFVLHYADLPLAYTFGDEVTGKLVRDRITADLSFAFSLLDRVQLSVALPVTLHQAGDLITYPDVVTREPRALPGISASGLEDLRLGLKGRFWSNEQFGFGGVAEVVAPTGNAGSFLGSESVTGTARLVGHARFQRLTVALNLGWRWAASEQRLLNIRSGNGLLYGAGVEVEVARYANMPISLLGEVYGLAAPGATDGVSSPAEAMLAGKAQVRDWSVFLGAGSGLNAGYGEPRVRVMAGLSYSWQYRPKPPPLVPPSVLPVIPSQPPSITVGEQDVRLQLWEPVYFAFAKDTIDPVSFPLLDEVARFIREHPELGPIRIDGHTDDVGSDQYNLELSQRRAKAIREYLGTKGVPAERLSHVGYGKRCPLLSNATEEGRAVNRRVDFILVNRERRHPRPGECPERPTPTPAPTPTPNQAQSRK